MYSGSTHVCINESPECICISQYRVDHVCWPTSERCIHTTHVPITLPAKVCYKTVSGNQPTTQSANIPGQSHAHTSSLRQTSEHLVTLSHDPKIILHHVEFKNPAPAAAEARTACDSQHGLAMV